MAAAADPSTPASSGLSPKEEGELEDGEISDDDNSRSRSSSSSSSGGGLLPYPRRRPPPPARGGGSGGGGGGSSSSSSSSQQQLRNFSRSRHPAERGQLRGPSSYRPKEPFRTHPPPGRMPSGSLSESSPRPSFWERSHIALDRFRFRGSRPYRGGSRWSRGRGVGERGGKPGCRPPGGGGSGGAGSGFGSSQSWREPSPPRKSSKSFGRSPSRKQNHSSKSENCAEETFEDLLLKYKQIQLELECINKDEKLALSSKEETAQEDPKTLHLEDQTSTDNASITKDPSKEVAPEEKTQVKTFQAFELKPYGEGLCVSLDPLPPLPPLRPLPPEDPEQPPKPPFADEEEEEEMLLREELLKSLASKRAFKPEETSSNSDPPSPPVLNNSQPLSRSNLSIVSINTVSQPRIQNPKFHRGPRLPRTLPKHKSVVVTLNDSDDSESDGEASKSTNSVFGGLESMIKEARRTAEQASKPKVPPKSEKENDPLRTPEALPEEKKMEYRLLKEEIANREKQRLIKSDQLKTSSSSPANSDVEMDGIGRIAMVTKQVADAEAKLKKHKIL